MDIRIAGMEQHSVVDGPGMRIVIFSQGCLHHCKGCHNPDTWPLNGGELTTTGEIMKRVREERMITGLTFSGGDPFLQATAFTELGRDAHEMGLDVVVYTGYTWEALLEHTAFGHEDFRQLIFETDFLVDGRYEHEQRTTTTPFRGSRNQRFIDVGKSLELGRTVEVALG